MGAQTFIVCSFCFCTDDNDLWNCCKWKSLGLNLSKSDSAELGWNPLSFYKQSWWLLCKAIKGHTERSKVYRLLTEIFNNYLLLKLHSSVTSKTEQIFLILHPFSKYFEPLYLLHFTVTWRRNQFLFHLTVLPLGKFPRWKVFLLVVLIVFSLAYSTPHSPTGLSPPGPLLNMYILPEWYCLWGSDL